MTGPARRRRPRKGAAFSAGEPRVLIAEERGSGSDGLNARLRERGLSVVAASGGEEAWSFFQQGPFDVVVTGLRLAELDGIGLLRRIRSSASRDPRVPVLLITAVGSLSQAAAAGRAGVTDCFSNDDAGVEALITRACSLVEFRAPAMPPALLCSSPALVAARDRILSLSNLYTPVLISGERGTAHTEVAEHLHALGTLAAKSLHRIDCSVETGATPGIGVGTRHLIEVHDLSASAQGSWHTFLRESQHGPQAGSIRILASTTRDLKVLAARKQFSADLARDLCQFEVWLPPLRERRDDIPKLVEAILDGVSERIGRPGMGISPRALDLLCASPWWENFPELESVLETLAAFAPGLEITEPQAELVLVDSDPVARAARERARSELTEANSNLPGLLTARVRENVYDSTTGEHLLIPQGTVITGVYDSVVTYGQERLLVAWQRLLFPDGTKLNLGSMPGVDAGGAAGFEDQVDRHYLQVFGSSTLLSVISAGLQISQGGINSGNTSENQNLTDTLGAALGQNLGEAASQLIRRNLNVQPQIEIRSGYRFNVVVRRDLIFRQPYGQA